MTGKRGTLEAVHSAQRIADDLRQRLNRAETEVHWRKIAFLHANGWQHRGVRTTSNPYAFTTYFFLTPSGQWFSVNAAVQSQLKRQRGASRRAAKKAGK